MVNRKENILCFVLNVNRRLKIVENDKIFKCKVALKNILRNANIKKVKRFV